MTRPQSKPSTAPLVNIGRALAAKNVQVDIIVQGRSPRTESTAAPQEPTPAAVKHPVHHAPTEKFNPQPVKVVVPPAGPVLTLAQLRVVLSVRVALLARTVEVVLLLAPAVQKARLKVPGSLPVATPVQPARPSTPSVQLLLPVPNALLATPPMV